MVTQLVHHDRIKTTVPKAKELRRIADKMVTWAKIGVSAGSAVAADVWAAVALAGRADASLPSWRQSAVVSEVTPGRQLLCCMRLLQAPTRIA